MSHCVLVICYNKLVTDLTVCVTVMQVQGSTIDQGSNMVKAFASFEGGACVNHRLNNCLKAALLVPGVDDVINKVIMYISVTQVPCSCEYILCDSVSLFLRCSPLFC